MVKANNKRRLYENGIWNHTNINDVMLLESERK